VALRTHRSIAHLEEAVNVGRKKFRPQRKEPKYNPNKERRT
jgi:hypothetical protein